MKAYAILHGMTDFDAEGRIIGANDPTLNDTGKAQADKLASELQNKNIDMILSSPQQRTMETAYIIADSLGIDRKRITKGLKLYERAFGELEGKKIEEVDMFALTSFFSSITPAQGEHVKETVNRVVPYMNNMTKLFRTKVMLLVVPEHVLRVLFWFFNGLPTLGHENNIDIVTGEIYEFDTDNIPAEIRDFSPIPIAASGDDSGGDDSELGRLLSQEEIDALIKELTGGSL